MPTKDELYRIIAAYGLGRSLPPGSTRAAARAATRGMVKAGRIVVPAAGRAAMPVAQTAGRGAVALARRHPALAAGALGYGAYEAGLLDPVIEPIQETFEQEVEIPLKRTLRKKSNFNRAVSAGMKTVRTSTSYGKKGTINNSKKAFTAVTKTVSKAFKGKTAPKKGVLRKVYQDAKKRIGKSARRKSVLLRGTRRGRGKY
jgi:hypothetical protein